jgi:hypothetical protein
MRVPLGIVVGSFAAIFAVVALELDNARTIQMVIPYGVLLLGQASAPPTCSAVRPVCAEARPRRQLRSSPWRSVQRCSRRAGAAASTALDFRFGSPPPWWPMRTSSRARSSPPASSVAAATMTPVSGARARVFADGSAELRGAYGPIPPASGKPIAGTPMGAAAVSVAVKAPSPVASSKTPQPTPQATPRDERTRGGPTPGYAALALGHVANARRAAVPRWWSCPRARRPEGRRLARA